jgi:hypothetical protein
LKTIFDAWKSFEAEIIPSVAGAVQREECRRAFYAGAAVTFTLVIAATGPEDETECERLLEKLDDELKAFGVEMATHGAPRS